MMLGLSSVHNDKTRKDNANNSDTIRALVRPTPHVPWDVAVVGVVPSLVHEETIRTNQVAAYDSYGSLQALMSTDGKITLFQDGDLLQRLYHPLLNRAESLLLAISGDQDSYYVFGLNATTGFLALWWLPQYQHKTKNTNATSMPSLVSKIPSCKLRLSLTSATASMVVRLFAVGNRLYLGTNTGSVWTCTVSTRPMVMTAVEMIRNHSSLWNRVFRMTTIATTNSGAATAGANSPNSPIVALMSTTTTPTTTTAQDDTTPTLYSITRSGCIDAWENDRGTTICHVEEVLENSLQDSFDGIEVLNASLLVEPHNNTDGQQILDMIVKVLRPRRARMYYLRYVHDNNNKPSLQLQQCTWLNCFSDSVPCHGIISCPNGMAYACFGSTPITVLALGGSASTVASPATSGIVHEVDLPLDEAPGMIGMGKDVPTHGIVVVTTEGLVLRVRWMQLQAAVAATSDEETHVLARHLRAAFWTFYQSNQLHLPPSLTATRVNLEASILVTARHLQQEGDGSSSHNTMEWHLAFIRLLQQTGLYKDLSSSGRWTLLGIGQELAIHHILTNSNLFFKELPPHGLAAKMAQVQRHVLDHAPTMEWSVVLQKVLTKAMHYREDHAIPTYDVLIDPRNLWTHELKDVLLVQLKHPETAQVETLEVIVTAALQVHQETHSRDYALVKSLGIELIRTQVKSDNVAYTLSLEHAYYEGLCQLSIDKPNEYSLEPILTRWDDFGSFALRWFTQQGHYDKALSYGKLLPHALEQLVQDHLPEYKWVCALRQKNYDIASDALFDNATGQNLEQTEWHLSMAKLAAKVDKSLKRSIDEDMDENVVSYRRKRIDNKLDLVKAQRALMEDDHVPLQTSDYLLKLAIDKFDKETDNPVEYAMMGLIIASAAENMDGIATIWSKVIANDMTEKWSVWIKSTPPPSRKVLVEETIFGQLWKHVQEQPVEVHATMQYDPDTRLEDLVMRKLTALDRGAARELKRLLRSVTTVVLSQSLMSGTMAMDVQ